MKYQCPRALVHASTIKFLDFSISLGVSEELRMLFSILSVLEYNDIVYVKVLLG